MKDYIIRRIKGKKQNKYTHEYFDKYNRPVESTIVKHCLNNLYLSPAHDNVKINLNKNDKILAIGYDDKGRPQYTYNKQFVKEREKSKYHHMIKFGESYQRIMRQIHKDLYTEGDTKQKQIAIILKLVIDCCFRIGNDKYTKENQSYGVSTLQSNHVTVNGSQINIKFRGKKGVSNACTLKNKKLSKMLRTKKRSIGKDHRLFTYRHKNRYFEVRSTDVNKYLKKFGNFSTKNFRTWTANLEFIQQIMKLETPKVETQCKKNITEALKKVADKLHNTPAVCRSNYIDPYLVEIYTTDNRRFIGTFENLTTKEEFTEKYIELLRNKI